MESSIAVFLKRQTACEPLPTNVSDWWKDLTGKRKVKLQLLNCFHGKGKRSWEKRSWEKAQLGRSPHKNCKNDLDDQT